ncbi:MAG: ECF transporter S component [Ruminococcaceae bacterium]|nr:ECF transporter S component [Oscillospiraceae bacterium]
MNHNTNNSITTKRFSTRRLVALALFTAMAYVISMLSFPVFPATPYLKLDFGNVFILLSAFLFGPIEGIVVCLLKEVLSLINSSSGGVGEIANFLMTSAYLILPAVVYRYKKGLRAVFLSLMGACVLGTVAALLANRFIVFPLYMKESAPTVFAGVFWFVVGFNLIKTVSISALTFLLYKRLSGVMKKLAVK